ncbi:hypothetical protein BN132_1593 [Cronobacter turicensis 564]|nr:hypothetical protein BN132_1593 [Cronobacter turicensis 564]
MYPALLQKHWPAEYMLCCVIRENSDKTQPERWRFQREIFRLNL